MSKNKTNNIEDIFRKAAADYPADFDAQHWQALKEKLDRGASGVSAMRNSQYKRAAWGLLLLLLVAGGTYWIGFSGITDEGDYQQITTEINAIPDEVQQNIGKESSKRENEEKRPSQLDVTTEGELKVGEVGIDKKFRMATDSVNIEEIRGDNGDTHASEEKPSKPRVAAENTRKTGNFRAENDPEEEIKGNDIGKSTIRPDDQRSMPLKDSSKSDLEVVNIKNEAHSEYEAPVEESGKAGSMEETEPQPQNMNRSVEQEFQDKTGRTPEQPGQTGQPAKNGDDVVEDLEQEQVEADSLNSDAERVVPGKRQKEFIERPLLGVSFTVGPDLSVLGLGEITRPGYSYGLVIHYNIGKRWSVGIGALKTTKRYVGTGYDYKPPKGYWEYATNNVIPERVAGECGLIEVPLDIRFDFLRSGRNNLHISTGVSSYFMQHESYEYDFKEPNPYGSQGWNSDGAGGSHLFNIINFSLGYERDISRKFSLGLAPYVKVPVKGIGWSEVKFVSFGTYFTFKYNFLTRGKSTNF